MSTDTIIDGLDFGPIACLVGTWKGEKGMDVSPEEDGSKVESTYNETIVFTVVGDVTNAGKQTLAVISYHQEVFRISNGEKFHDQIGYWIWDKDTNTVMHSISIPRGVTLLAGGTVNAGKFTATSALLKLEASEGGEWGIAQSPFMRNNAKTTAYKMAMKVDGDKMSYAQTTYLDIYGRSFDHTDKSGLTKVS
ncbi:MAG: FABP family protein [Pseudomonadales bacterium]|nr:FABP family protein [Pseudomonadales bacterium]